MLSARCLLSVSEAEGHHAHGRVQVVVAFAPQGKRDDVPVTYLSYAMCQRSRVQGVNNV